MFSVKKRIPKINWIFCAITRVVIVSFCLVTMRTTIRNIFQLSSLILSKLLKQIFFQELSPIIFDMEKNIELIKISDQEETLILNQMIQSCISLLLLLTHNRNVQSMLMIWPQHEDNLTKDTN